jgi:TetR/AcrR family fatty acid metabolism transcriptional regulator
MMDSVPNLVDTIAAPASSHDRILAAAKRLFASQGYEATSTMAIARHAGTSESQMMKHFGSKEGLLEAILDEGWKSMAPRFEEIATLPAGVKKLLAMLDIVLTTLNNDPDLKELLLLEGRRVRREGRMIVLSSGYLRFVGMVDEVLHQMAAAGNLRPDVSPEAVRSAIMGITEGMMRDQVLSHRREFPANFSDDDYRRIFFLSLHAMTVKPKSPTKTAPAKSTAARKR